LCKLFTILSYIARLQNRLTLKIKKTATLIIIKMLIINIIISKTNSKIMRIIINYKGGKHKMMFKYYNLNQIIQLHIIIAIKINKINILNLDSFRNN